MQLFLISSSLEVKYGVTKRLFPTVQINQGTPPINTQQITAKDAAMAAAVQKAVAMGPVPAPSGSPAPSQPDSATPRTPTSAVSKTLLRPIGQIADARPLQGGSKKAKKRK